MALPRGLESLIEAGMMHGTVRDCLQEAVEAAHKGSGTYAHYVDHNGDGESGDCIYMANGKCMSAPYTIGTVGGKHTAQLETESAHETQPIVTYAPVADDADNYAAMSEAGIYTKDGGIPLCERFISKAERDKADAADFAGKGKSFPILKPEDVGAAVHSMGRAGSGNHSANTLKKNIVAIAKRKGYTSSLPKDWQEDGDMDASAAGKEAKVIDITGDLIHLREGAVGQDGTVLLKVIAPGWGSSGYYSPELLERDLPKIYPAGTKQFWNHQTEAQERERPEGDLRDVASVALEPVRYMANGPDGPGGYAKVRASSEFRQPIDELAGLKALGVSIRASGKAVEGTAEGRKGPIIQELTRGLSYDYVTEAGAGGKVLQLFEAARKRPETQGDAMTETELREMRDLRAEVKKMKERGAIADAAGVIAGFFKTVRVGEAIEQRVTARLLERNVPMTATGDLDQTALKKLWEAETKDEAEYVSKMSGGRIVVNMGGITEAAKLTPEEEKAARKAEKRRMKEGAREYGFSTEMGARIFNEGRAAFDPNYNVREDAEKVAA